MHLRIAIWFEHAIIPIEENSFCRAHRFLLIASQSPWIFCVDNGFICKAWSSWSPITSAGQVERWIRHSRQHVGRRGAMKQIWSIHEVHTFNYIRYIRTLCSELACASQCNIWQYWTGSSRKSREDSISSYFVASSAVLSFTIFWHAVTRATRSDT